MRTVIPTLLDILVKRMDFIQSYYVIFVLCYVPHTSGEAHQWGRVKQCKDSDPRFSCQTERVQYLKLKHKTLLHNGLVVGH